MLTRATAKVAASRLKVLPSLARRPLLTVEVEREPSPLAEPSGLPIVTLNSSNTTIQSFGSWKHSSPAEPKEASIPGLDKLEAEEIKGCRDEDYEYAKKAIFKALGGNNYDKSILIAKGYLKKHPLGTTGEMKPSAVILFQINMRHFVSLRYAQRVRQLFDSMRQSAALISALTCGRFIKDCVEGKWGEGALLVLEIMREFGVPRNAVVYTSLITAFSQPPNLNKEIALRIFSEMKAEGVEPVSYTYSSLLKLCALGNGDTPLAQRLIAEAKAKKGLFDNVFLTSALNFYAVTRDKESAIAIFNEAITLGVAPNVYNYSALIKAYSVTRDLPGARKTFAELKARESKKIPAMVYDTMVSLCARVGDAAYAVELIEEELATQSNLVEPSTVNCALTVLAGLKRIDSAAALYASVLAKAPKAIDAVATNTVVALLVEAKQLERAWSIATEALERGAVNEWTFGLLLRICLYSSKPTEAEEFFKQMPRRRLRPTAAHYTLMSKILYKAGRVEESKRYDEAKRAAKPSSSPEERSDPRTMNLEE